ncbi:chorismate mutase [Parvibaculum sp. MBR-TMA-1.3b-4.2]|jgi:chorismate mutase-like protein
MTSETQSPVKQAGTGDDSAPALADVRREIDAIDDAIHDLLMKRTELVVDVANAKARDASAAGEGSFIAFRPGREAEVLRRLAGRHEGRLPLRVVFRLWREIISAMTRIQGPFRVEVYGGADTDALAYWDLARNYYGSITEMTLHDSMRDLTRRVSQDRSAIGILPRPGNYPGGDWWTALAGRGVPLRVVTQLPFAHIDGLEGEVGALVVAQAEFEPTGDDTSLIAISARGSVSETKLAQLLNAAGIEAERLSVAVTQDGEPRHLSLYAVPGYLEAGDARLAALIAEPVDDVYVLGGFANPVRRDADTD